MTKGNCLKSLFAVTGFIVVNNMAKCLVFYRCNCGCHLNHLGKSWFPGTSCLVVRWASEIAGIVDD